ncbi:MAG: RsmB/NOP family class I SAM-dependent RNA methyltransferase [Chthoniobacteraceae bacterium]
MKVHPNVAEAIVGALLDIFKQGRYADRVIESSLKEHTKWGSRDRRLVAETVYDLVRWWRSYWYLTGLPDAECLDQEKVSARRVWHVWGVYVWRQTGEFPAMRECEGLDSRMIGHRLEVKTKPAIRASIPDWLDETCAAELGECWPAVLDALNEKADVFLRANALKNTTAELVRTLTDERIDVDPVEGLPDAVRLRERRNVFNTPAFHAGLFEVQDSASQRIAPMLEVASGMRVIDACAGAGGKTLHLAALMKNKGRIIALDVHQWKLDELRRRAARAGADTIVTRLIESPKTIKDMHESADRVLLDVPCSGLGVLRRNPDTKWKFKPEELDRLRALQADILRRYSRMTKPGGKLVYATCSILPSENEKQVQSFLAEAGAQWQLDTELTLRPDRDGTDGFYAARLVRVS